MKVEKLAVVVHLDIGSRRRWRVNLDGLRATKVASGERPWPNDVCFLHQRLAMLLGRLCELNCLEARRNGVCRYFGLTERAGRFL